jgi:NADH dehydrogenase [ubiquinone] 1 alpha subcomplex assembly factor 1
MIKYRLLIDFQSTGAEKRWEVINDEVMGGLSKGRLTITPNKTALFEGTVSLENNGGFASVRTNPADFFLDGFKGLTIKVKGDGRRYRLRLKTTKTAEGVAYQTSFATQPEIWISPFFPFSEFVPFFRGEVVSDAPVLNPADIRQIGLMIADKQPGPFRLEIEWIKAFLGY